MRGVCCTPNNVNVNVNVMLLRMDRSTFESALAQIAARVKLLESDFREESFGSWHVTVAVSPKRRLVWDGRERWLLVELRTAETRAGFSVWRELWIKRAAGEADVSAAIERLLQTPNQDAT